MTDIAYRVMYIFLVIGGGAMIAYAFILLRNQINDLQKKFENFEKRINNKKQGEFETGFVSLTDTPATAESPRQTVRFGDHLEFGKNNIEENTQPSSVEVAIGDVELGLKELREEMAAAKTEINEQSQEWVNRLNRDSSELRLLLLDQKDLLNDKFDKIMVRLVCLLMISLGLMAVDIFM